MSAGTLIRNWKTPMIEPDSPVERITAKRYDAMVAAGIYTEEDPLELLDGFLVRKMTKGEHHDWSTDDLNAILLAAMPRNVTVRCQNTLLLETSRPEPDFVICKTAMERKGKQPRAKDTYIVIEVAESSLGRDRGLKQRLYAEAGIPCYWVVNLIARQIEVYSDPDAVNRKYLSRIDYKLGREVPVIVRKQVIGSIPVDAVFPFAKKKS